MTRLVALFAVGAAVAIGVAACGDGEKKPPLTPDTEHPVEAVPEAGMPSTPPVSSAPPSK